MPDWQQLTETMPTYRRPQQTQDRKVSSVDKSYPDISTQGHRDSHKRRRNTPCFGTRNKKIMHGTTLSTKSSLKIKETWCVVHAYIAQDSCSSVYLQWSYAIKFETQKYLWSLQRKWILRYKPNMSRNLSQKNPQNTTKEHLKYLKWKYMLCSKKSQHSKCEPSPTHWLEAILIKTKQDFCSHAEANPKM